MSNQCLDKTTTSQLMVRSATADDLTQVAHIARITWEATYRDTIAPENRREFLNRAYKPENLLDAIDAPGHWFYVAEVAGQTVGFAHFFRRYHPTEPRAELVRLYILPAYQNQGIGARLLKTGFTALYSVGIKLCFVSVQVSNAAARRFYERHRFVEHRTHGQFLGTQIITLIEFVRPITEEDIQK